MADSENGVSKRILIVDDDKFLLEFFGRILTANGYTTVLSNNGLDAKGILEEDKEFDMIILDLLMPVQSGWKLMDFLKEHETYKSKPIVVMTGLSLTYEEFERIKATCTAVLLKGDFELSRFITIIEDNI